MPDKFKALIVIVGITLLVLSLARPIAIRFMAAEDFARRRNIWLCLVLSAFLISNYWLYVLVATIVMGYGVKRDPNPAALYMFLLLAMPPFGDEIPTLGMINQVFALDHLRLVSLVILLPTFLQLPRVGGAGSVPSGAQPDQPRFAAPDMLIVLFCALQLALWLPYDSPTATIRRAILFFIDVLLPYFVLSRACRHRESLRETMAAFVLVAIVLSCMGVFESARSWLLFAGVEETWGTTLVITGFLRRGDTLRATVTGGHSIVLGFALMIAFGLWLSLRTKVAAAGWRSLGLLGLVAGLAATFARGPWVGTMLTLLCFQGLQPKGVSRMAKTLVALATLAGIVLVSPWGPGFIDRLPFIGSDPGGSVGYRQRLAALSWLLITQNPLLGTLNFMQYMEELRQGEGIIDLVNAYVGFALAFGMVGLGLFVGLFATIGFRCLSIVRRSRNSDPDLSAMGASLLACMAGVLVTLATCSMYLSVSTLTWAIAGLGAAYVRMATRESISQSAVPQ